MVSVIGRRREMRDTVSVAIGEIGDYDFFSICNGPRVANACRERLGGLVEEETRTRSREGAVDWERVMKACFTGMEETLGFSAATAVVMVGEDEVVVARRGGSKAVLCRAGVALPFCHLDHTHDEGERASISKRTECDDFILIASKGLWDLVSEVETCQVVKGCLDGRIKRKYLDGLASGCLEAEAAAVLAELAMARGSRDNISVIVVELKN